LPSPGPARARRHDGGRGPRPPQRNRRPLQHRVSAGREGAIVTILIGLTEPGCMMGASFAVQARERLEPLPGVARVEVELQHDCDWTPADLDARYARRLEEVRAAARRSREVGVS